MLRAGEQPELAQPVLSSGRLRNAWDQASIGVVVVDPGGRVHYLNRTASRLAGLEERELVAVLQNEGPGGFVDLRGRPLQLMTFPAIAAAAQGRSHRGTTVQLEWPERPPVRLRVEAIPLELDGDSTPDLLMLTVTSVRNQARADEAARLLASRGQMLADISKALAEGMPDVAAVTRAVAQRVSAWRGEAVLITLLEGDSDMLTLSAAAHPDPEVEQFFYGFESAGGLQSGQGLSGQVTATGQPMVMHSLPGRRLAEMLVPSHRDWFRKHASEAVKAMLNGTVNLALVPLIARGRAIGALTVGSWGELAAATSEEDVTWLREVADLTALAIANARLYDEASTRLRMLEASSRVDLAMVASLDLRLTLDLILDQLTALMDVDASAVLLAADGGEGLRVYAAVGFRQPRIGQAGHPIAQQVLATGVPLNLAGPDLDGFIREAGLLQEAFVTAELVPLSAHGESLGVLQLFQRTQKVVDSEHRFGIDALAVRAALAIEAASQGRAAAGADVAGPPDVSRRLSVAQLAVFRLLVEGKTNRQIASRLHISENTVKTHLRGIFGRLGVRTRLEAAMKVTSPLPNWPDAVENHPFGLRD